jgi:hypothetical protein
MDSGCAVPTLSCGFSETVAVKLLTVASGRCRAGVAAGAANSGFAGAAIAASSMLRRSARRFADDNAGSNKAATRPMIAMTTMSSMRVKAGERIFISLTPFVFLQASPLPRRSCAQIEQPARRVGKIAR